MIPELIGATLAEYQQGGSRASFIEGSSRPALPRARNYWAASCAQSKCGPSSLPPLVTFTADQDHQNMVDQLGIKALRPGPCGDEGAPNHANYDEPKANPYPNLPDPLRPNNGQKVTTPAMWWNECRPQIVDM